MVKTYDINFYAQPQFHLHIDLTDACNYNCEYCYIKKSKSHSILNVDILQSFIQHVKAKLRKHLQIWILGGEPTLHPKLLKLICSNESSTISLYSNFSADIELYKSILMHNVNLYISIHPSQIIVEDIVRKMSMLNKDEILKTTIELMNDYCYQESITKIYYRLKDQFNANISIVNIFENLNSSYKVPFKLKTNTIYIDDNTNDKTYAVENNGIRKLISENELFIMRKRQAFIGTICNASIDSLYVSPNGDLYPCPSMHYFGENFYRLGNIYKSYSFTQKTHICKYQMCCIPQIIKRSHD